MTSSDKRKASQHKHRQTDKYKATQQRHLQKDWVKKKRKGYKQTPSNKAQSAKYSKTKNLQLRIDVLEAYGAKCVECSEENFFFLTLDHINNDGYIDAKNIGRGALMFQHLIDAGLSNLNKGLQILCHGCNALKEMHRRALKHDKNAVLYKHTCQFRSNVFTVAKAKAMGATKLLEIITQLKSKSNKDV